MVDALSHLKEGWQKQAVEKGLCTEADLRLAQARVRAGAGVEDVAEALVQMGIATEERVAQLKADAAGLAYVDVLDYQVDQKALQLVSEALARKHTLLPLYCVGDSLTVAVRDPWDATAIDEVRLSAKLTGIRPVLGTASAIRKAIDRQYGRKVVEEASQGLSRPSGDGQGSPVSGGAGGQPRKAARVSGEVSVTKLVDALLTEALEVRASDIHLEPEERQLRVRYRVDGVLQEGDALPIYLHEGVASRIKLLAKLDITEHRLPQDGHLPLTIDGRLIDLRISTYPTVFGENVVIRLLDHQSLQRGLNALGLSPKVLGQYVELIQRPHGIVLVTGPTGSGKTTTLYASLGHVNSVEKNIMTIEDPVEYRLPLIRQTQINVKAGVTFSAGLRSLLRQDPDVIMVGEIRDHDTAEIAVHAALTGHLVLSTLHTNDAVGSIARLLDMGIESFLLASTLLGVVAQRLVRCVCPQCREVYRADAAMCERDPQLAQLCRGRGCRSCRQTGYYGRMGIFELFRVDSATRRLIAERRPSDELRRLALSTGMGTMREDGLSKVQQGLTSLEELDRIMPGEAGA